MDSGSLTANIPLLYLFSHPEEAGIDANSFTVSTLVVLHIIYFCLGLPGIIPVTVSIDLPQIILPHRGQPGRASQ